MKRLTILNLFDIRDISEHEKIRHKLRKGLRIDLVDSGGRTLLMEAVVHADHSLVEMLVKLGANVNLKDNRNWTALHFASQNDDVLLAKHLIENGAEINPVDDYGNTPIARAVFSFQGNSGLIELLKANGADLDHKNKSGISARDLARSISNYDIAQYVE